MLSFQAAQRIKTPAKYVVGTYTIPFNPSAFGEVNAIFIDYKVIYFISLGKYIKYPFLVYCRFFFSSPRLYST